MQAVLVLWDVFYFAFLLPVVRFSVCVYHQSHTSFSWRLLLSLWENNLQANKCPALSCRNAQYRPTFNIWILQGDLTGGDTSPRKSQGTYSLSGNPGTTAWHHLWWCSGGGDLVAQSCPTLVTPCSPPGSSVHGILQARTLEWVAIPFSRGSFQPRKRTLVSCTAGGWCRDDVVSTANSWAPCPELLEETSGGEIFNQCFYQLTCMCTNIRNYRNKEEKKRSHSVMYDSLQPRWL